MLCKVKPILTETQTRFIPGYGGRKMKLLSATTAQLSLAALPLPSSLF